MSGITKVEQHQRDLVAFRSLDEIERGAAAGRGNGAHAGTGDRGLEQTALYRIVVDNKNGLRHRGPLGVRNAPIVACHRLRADLKPVLARDSEAALGDGERAVKKALAVSEKGIDYWSYFMTDARKAGSPLYARLAEGVGGDEELKALTARAKPGQPHANLLLGAVHFLLLRGAEHPLRRHYPDLGGVAPQGEDPFPVFRDFIHANQGENREA